MEKVTDGKIQTPRIVVGEVGVGEEGDQASSGTHPGLPLIQPLPNQIPDQARP